MDADVRQRNNELSQNKRKLSEMQIRIKELDNIFQRIYEDNISGKLSDERFMKLSKGYELEQYILQNEVVTLNQELTLEESKNINVDRFISIVKKYTDMTGLTPEIL